MTFRNLTPSMIMSTLRRMVHHISAPLLYAALLMYYAYRRSDTPAWAKRIVMGAFVYLFSPIDAIPDLSPFIGYTDDLGVLMYGLVMIAAYIDQDVRASARRTLYTWIGHTSESSLRKMDDLL